MKKFIIVSAGRSGSTLVKTILSAHSEVAIPTELFFFNSVAKSLRTCVRHADNTLVLDEAIQILSSKWWIKNSNFDWIDVRDRLNMLNSVSEIDLWEVMLDSFGAANGAKIVGEKTISNIYHLDTIVSKVPSIKIIFIYRDLRAVAWSRLKSNVGFSDLHTISRDWVDCIQTMNRRKCDSNVMLVAYEDLVADPIAISRQICSFLEIIFEDSMLDFHKRSVLGYDTQQSHHFQTTRPVSKGSITKWESSLSIRQLKYLESRAGNYIAKLGYKLIYPRMIKIPYYYVVYQHFLRPISKCKSKLRQIYKSINDNF